MKNMLKIFALVLSITFLPAYFVNAGLEVPETDTNDSILLGFFDLRDRETFIQVTNIGSINHMLHIQIFNVDQDCNENNFFDTFTPTDTHTYNLRDIQTNDGNPSGVVLPQGAYGIIAISQPNVDPFIQSIIGNLRVLDSNGYEYRTNLAGVQDNIGSEPNELHFNFNTISGVTVSDIIGISNNILDSNDIEAANVVDNFYTLDVDLFNTNEVPFSCRNVTFACVDQDHPLLEELLEETNSGGNGSNVASFEYGINNAIPHSKGGELLCPGNNISEGFATLRQINRGNDTDGSFVVFIGLNNGNGRGSLDTAWYNTIFVFTSTEG